MDYFKEHIEYMSDISFDNYQDSIVKFCRYRDHDVIGKIPSYPMYELAGEVGEVFEKVKKIDRDKEGVLSLQDEQEIAKELGDVLFAVARLSTHLGFNFSYIASLNLDKLQSRLDRNKITGSGDNR